MNDFLNMVGGAANGGSWSIFMPPPSSCVVTNAHIGPCGAPDCWALNSWTLTAAPAFVATNQTAPAAISVTFDWQASCSNGGADEKEFSGFCDPCGGFRKHRIGCPTRRTS